jgi:hypothetical protein
MTTRRIVIVLAGGALLLAIAGGVVAVSLLFATGGVDTARTNLMVWCLSISVLLIRAALSVSRREKSHL